MTTVLDVWMQNKDFLDGKSVEQIIAITNNGILSDSSETSNQFHDLIANIPSVKVAQYCNECLSRPLNQGGFILQDLVNEIGRRIGFDVEFGQYRGKVGQIGFDGIWRTKGGHSIVVEVKTTDAYQINLDTYADYRRKLIESNSIAKDSSVLIVVGRKDTGGLESQVRGSRHAYDIRLISIDALIKLVQVKETLSDNSTIEKIREILRPMEYTRVDKLIDVIFSTSEDVQNEFLDTDGSGDSNSLSGNEISESEKSVGYHDICMEKVSSVLHLPLIKRGSRIYSSADEKTRVVCIISKEYKRGVFLRYWYAFRTAQKEYLQEGDRSYIALGCGSPNMVFLIPYALLEKRLTDMRITTTRGRQYWHVEIFKSHNSFWLSHPSANKGMDISEFILG